MKVAEIKVSYSTNQPYKVRLTNFKDTYQFILSHWDMNIIEYQEECKIILLNRGNEVLGIHQLSKGGISGTIVDLRIVLAIALKCNASGIILAHNHPSGNIQPSEADKKITKRLKQACELLEITLIDHLIISKQDCLSFAQEGINIKKLHFFPSLICRKGKTTTFILFHFQVLANSLQMCTITLIRKIHSFYTFLETER